MKYKLILTVAALALSSAMAPAALGQSYNTSSDAGLLAGQLDVPLNKSQVVTVDRAFAKAMVGNEDIADIVPVTNRSLYVLGKKMGTTSLTIYDTNNLPFGARTKSSIGRTFPKGSSPSCAAP